MKEWIQWWFIQQLSKR